jgi:hypothetical protein
VDGSSRSPTINIFSKQDKSYFASNEALGSSFRIALNTVGAAKIAFTAYSSITRQNALASWVLLAYLQTLLWCLPVVSEVYRI